MRKNYLLRTALSLLALLCSFVPSWGAAGEYTYDGKGTFKQITSVDEVTEGYYVLVSQEKALPGALAKKPVGTDVTIVDGAISDPSKSIVWKIEKPGEYYCLLNSSSQYLSWASSTDFATSSGDKTNTKAQYLVSQESLQAFSFVISNTASATTVRGIVYRTGSTNKWGPYAVSNINNSEYFHPQLYKLDESAPSLTEATISFDGITDSLEKNLTEGSYKSVATSNSNATITYSSSVESVATIATDGTVTLLSGGETTITASVAQTDTHKAAEVSYLLTVVDNSDPQLAFVTEGIVDEGEYSIDLSAGTLNSAVTSVAGSTGTITYVSSVEEVAMIDETTGEIVLMGAGETIISATIVAAGDFKTQTISYTLTVTDKMIRGVVIFNGIAEADGGYNSWRNISSSYITTPTNKDFVGSDGNLYTWNVDEVMKSTEKLQMRSSTGIIISPTIITEEGFDVTITFTCNKTDAKLSATGTTEVATGSGTELTLRVPASESVITFESGTNATYVTEIKIVPIGVKMPGAIEGIEDKVSKHLVDGSYKITATTNNTDNSTITYTTEDTDIVTIEENVVTFVKDGIATIIASTVETANFTAATASFELTVKPTAILTETVTFTDWSVVVGSTYDECAGDQILPGSDTKNYTWNFTRVKKQSVTALRPEAGSESVLESPAFQSAEGFVYTVTFEGEGNVTLTAKDGTTVEGASPLSLVVASTEANWVRLTNPTATTDITAIEVQFGSPSTPIIPTPQLVFADATLTGTVERLTTDDSFDSQATVTLEGFDNVPVVYSSTEESVATISTEGLVTIHGAGETVISAEVVAVDGQYDGATVEYTLVVKKELELRKFVRITKLDEFGQGEYILVGKSVAMKNEYNSSSSNKIAQEESIVIESDAEQEYIESADATIIWKITKTTNGYSIYNEESKQYVGFSGTKNTANLYDTFEEKTCEFTLSEYTNSSNEYLFSLTSVKGTSYQLQYNSNSSGGELFACYSSNQNRLALYKLEVIYTVTVAPTHVNYTLNNSAGSAIAGTDDDIHETTAREGEVLSLVINSMPAAQYVKSVKWGDTELSAPHGSYTFTVDGDKTLTIETGEYCVPEDVEMSYTGSYVESVSLTSSLWEDGKFLLNMHPAETHHVYLNYTDGVMGSSFPVLVNDPVTITSVCKGESLNPGYLYVDWNKDGAFDPATEMVASAESVAALSGFTVTDEHAAGLYRARLEVDTDNTTPCALNDLDSNVAKGSVMADFDIHYFLTTPDPNDPTGVEGIEENEIQLYYHAGTIYTNAEGEIQVYDLSGKLVRCAHVAPVAVDDLAGGVYIVRVNGRTMKFMK